MSTLELNKRMQYIANQPNVFVQSMLARRLNDTGFWKFIKHYKNNLSKDS